MRTLRLRLYFFSAISARTEFTFCIASLHSSRVTTFMISGVFIRHVLELRVDDELDMIVI